MLLGSLDNPRRNVLTRDLRLINDYLHNNVPSPSESNQMKVIVIVHILFETPWGSNCSNRAKRCVTDKQHPARCLEVCTIWPSGVPGNRNDTILTFL